MHFLKKKKFFKEKEKSYYKKGKIGFSDCLGSRFCLYFEA